MLFKAKALRIVKTLLTKGPLTQRQLATASKSSLGYANDVVQVLRKKLLTPSGRGIKITDPRRLFLTMAAESSMTERLYKSYEISGKRGDIELGIAQQFSRLDYALTLLSALPNYANLAQGAQISFYVNEAQFKQAEKALKKLGAQESKLGNVHVFAAHEGILYDRKKFGSVYCVSLQQLLIDLYSYPPLLYVGQELLLAKEKQVNGNA